MSDPLVVVITFGRQDLQILCLEDDEPRLVVNPGNIGEFHRGLESGSIRYVWWLPEEGARLKELRGFDFNSSDDAYSVRNRDGNELTLAQPTDIGLQNAPKPTIVLVPAILRERLRELQDDLKDGLTVKRIVLVHTRRAETSEWWKREPTAGAPLLERWMQEWSPPIPKDRICVVECLQDEEELNVRTSREEVLPNPIAAHRLSDCFREITQSQEPMTVRLHDSAGIPEITAAVRSSAKLHFARIDHRPPDEKKHGKLVVQADLEHGSTELLNARRQALQLVSQGAYREAAALSLLFQRSDRVGSWNRCLWAVAQYFGGHVKDARKRAKRLAKQGFRTGRELGVILDSAQPKALHVAMRAEAALRSLDLLEAASQTVTFSDVALFDAIDAFLSAGSGCVDWKRRAVRQTDSKGTALTKFSERQLRSCVPANIHRRNVDDWLSYNSQRTKEGWQELTFIDLLRTIGGKPTLAKLLSTLSRQASTECIIRGDKRLSPKFIRNCHQHSLLQESDVKDIATVFTFNNLWSVGDERSSILNGNTLPSKILQGLKVSDPLKLYTDLENAVREDILDCPVVVEESPSD